MSILTSICPFISIDQFLKKSGWETNKYSPILPCCKSQVKCHAYSDVLVVFPVLSLHVLFHETIDMGSVPTSSGLSLPISFQFCRS